MPQIWLSMEELGELLGEDPQAVRDAAVAAGRTTRETPDGITRLLLSDAMAVEYIRICGERIAVADATSSAVPAVPSPDEHERRSAPAPAVEASVEAPRPGLALSLKPLRFLQLARRRQVA